jgi:sterol desaturase/sphingolipid hydroxylase (fatty acid hydroxylase superfamily)
MSLEHWALPELCLLAVLVFYAALVALDAARPARRFERVPFWKAKGAAFFVLYLLVSYHLPFVWDAFLAEHRLIDASALGVGWGALVGLLVLELGVYVWHRTLHAVPFLWRWFHQTHHSAERVDIWGAMYFHPLDMAGFTAVTSLSLVGGVGVVPEAAVIAGTISTGLAIFQHANLKTPAWLGYLVSRPESHARHHERGVHARNYSDLPLWDILFGTFDNPETWQGLAGFYSGASRRLGALLCGRDISSQASGPAEVSKAERLAADAALELNRSSMWRRSARPTWW